MPSSSGLTAATISVSQTLNLLDGSFADLADALAKRQYALWLGSGISRERVDDLKRILKRLLSHLRDNIDTTVTNCPFRRALLEALSYAQLSPADSDGVDFSRPVDTWASLPVILERLVNAYARVLDIRVEGKPADYLLWDVVDVRATFAGAEPDCEHLCIVILAIEGVLPEVASANWDGLIEAAELELTGGVRGVLRVCVHPSDLREPPLRTRLLKFHGCAIRAAVDPAIYRPLLIAQHSRITGWSTYAAFAPMRLQLVNVAATKPTLMIGLSAQDSNIQYVFAKADATMSWTWPCTPPAHVFAEDSLGSDQRNILRCVYRDAYDTNSAAIESGALLRAFAKPLLLALVLHTLCSKLRALVCAVDAPSLTDSDRETLASGIIYLRNQIAAAEVPTRRLEFVRSLVRLSARALSLFQDGRIPANPQTYRALGTAPVNQIALDPTLSTSGLREMACALGLVGWGGAINAWRVEPGDPANDRDGAIRVTPSGRADVVRVFFVANSAAALHLEVDGIVREDDADAIVIHSTAIAPRMRRSPRAAPGRTGRRVARNVDMATLLNEVSSVTDLQRRFREEAAL